MIDAEGKSRLAQRFRVWEDTIDNHCHHTTYLLPRYEVMEHELSDGRDTYVGAILSPRMIDSGRRPYFSPVFGWDYEHPTLFGAAQIEKYSPTAGFMRRLFLGGRVYSVTTKDLCNPFSSAGLTGQSECEWELHKQASERGIVLPPQIVRELFDSIKKKLGSLTTEYYEITRMRRT